MQKNNLHGHYYDASNPVICHSHFTQEPWKEQSFVMKASAIVSHLNHMPNSNSHVLRQPPLLRISNTITLDSRGCHLGSLSVTRCFTTTQVFLSSELHTTPQVLLNRSGKPNTVQLHTIHHHNPAKTSALKTLAIKFPLEQQVQRRKGLVLVPLNQQGYHLSPHD
jgi:hypothetical protein